MTLDLSHLSYQITSTHQKAGHAKVVYKMNSTEAELAFVDHRIKHRLGCIKLDCGPFALVGRFAASSQASNSFE